MWSSAALLTKKYFFQHPADIFDFLATIFEPPPLILSQSQDPRIRDIASSLNIFKNFNSQNCLTKKKYCEFEGLAIVMGKFSKMFDEDSISRIRGSCDDWDGRGKGGTKIEAKKSKMSAWRRKKKWFLARSTADGPANTNHQEVSLVLLCKVLPDYEVGRLFFDIYRHLAELDVKPIGLVRRDKVARLIVYTWIFKLVYQAARPSRSTNLAGRLAVWTRL